MDSQDGSYYASYYSDSDHDHNSPRKPQPKSAPLAVKNRGLLRAVCVYGAFLVIHHVAANIYPSHCAPSGIIGAISSAVYAPSPQCKALRWCITQGAEALNTMWVVAASWCASHLVVPS